MAVLSIHGRSGTGKTATVRRIISGNTKFRSYYFNTISLTNVRSILLEIIHGGRAFVMANQSYTELFEKIGQMRDKNILLVLDEATNILKFDREGIYNLIRNKEIYVEFFSKFYRGNGKQFTPFGTSRKYTEEKYRA